MPDLSIANVGDKDVNAREFRRIQKFGLHISDFLAISGTKAYPGFGSGNVYTVQDWINSGAFANLAAVQVVYPICQATTDYVDWIIIQSAIDFAVYGSLGNGNRAGMKRIVRLPAGNFNINRTLHIGYGTLGTPPASLNGNGYVQVTIEGEGSQYDPSGNGMPGTTITCSDLTFMGIAITRGVDVVLRDFTLQGAYDSWMANNVNTVYRSATAWDVATWRRSSPAIADANWIDGNALNVGVCMSPYSDAASAAAYPARVLPSYFGGGTSMASTGSQGGSGLFLENVNIVGFIVGLGRPYGDQNDEYISYHGGTIKNCIFSVVTRHSQNRNISFRDCKIEASHTAFSNRGGPNLSGNANMHGAYDNIHFGRCYQLISADVGGWSGPITFTNCYAESFRSIGRVDGPVFKLVDSFLSFIEPECTDGVPPYHFAGAKIVLDNSFVGITRHGFMTNGLTFNSVTEVHVVNGSLMDSQVGGRDNPAGSTFNGIADIAKIMSGFRYMRYIFSLPGRWSSIQLDETVSEYGPHNQNDGNRSDEMVDVHLRQEWTQFYAKYPHTANPNNIGSNEMQGSVQSFRVPKISAYQFGGFNVNSRSGYDLVCDRITFGDIKMDIGDVIMLDPGGATATKTATWFIIISITGGGSTVTMRQLNNFDSTNGTNYFTNGWNQVSPGWNGNALWICTRIRQNHRLWVGDVTAGSNVITNVRHAFRFGSTDDFVSGNLGMKVNDFFLHQELQRSASGGGVKVHNAITGIDYTANTITLTENFNITQSAYPLPFFVETHNA
jgi:hypothetical protein